MSQRKKQGYSGSLSSGTRAGQARSPERSRAPITRPGARDDNRRRIAIGIGVVGLIIVAWVLGVSFGSGGSGAATSATTATSQPQQNADAKALQATIASLQDRLKQNPLDVNAMIDLGNSYYDAGQYSDAIPWYEKALQENPTNTDVGTDLGTAYFYSGNLDKAKAQWFKVLQQDPNKVQTHYNLAILYSHETPPDMDNAVKEWQTVIKLAPNSDQAKSAEQRLQQLGR